MSPTTFQAWLAEMKSAGLAPTDRAAAELLGVHYNAITRWRKLGTTKPVALACRALLHRLEPYGD